MNINETKQVMQWYDQTFPAVKKEETSSTITKELTETKEKKDVWDDYKCIERGLNNPPELDTAWHQNKLGKEIERWDLNNKDGNVVMKIVRFQNPGEKKNDRPFTLWSNGETFKWRSKALPAKYPLYGLLELLKRPDDPVLLTEGQKTASRAAAVLGDDYVCIGWYGGTTAMNKTDWLPIIGRKLYYWVDADETGKKTIKEIQKKDCDLKIVLPPVSVPKGWDIADAILDGWDKKKLKEFIESEKKNVFLEDNPFPFKVVGISGKNIIFFPFAARRIIPYQLSSLTKNCLMSLVDREMWAEYYGKDGGGIAWDSAINDILRTAEKAPLFDHHKLRGSGAWIDNNQIVINTGEYLLINGKRIADDFKSEYIYEKSKFIPYRIETPLLLSKAIELKNIINKIPFKNKIDNMLMLGWIVLAPWCGVLKWRPHIWLTGSKATGKSWILEEIISPMLNKFAVMAKGTSTAAGIRQALTSCAISTIMDEMESDNSSFEGNIEQNLKIFRESTSGNDIAVLHGTSNGEGKQWIVNTMAFLASIGAALKHGADIDRFTILTLRNKKQGEIKEEQANFEKLKKNAKTLTSSWSESYHARTYNIIDELLKCVEIMINQTSIILGNKRSGDQIGTLMAGAWMGENDHSATNDEAKEWLLQQNIENIMLENESKADEELLLDEILSSYIDITDGHTRERITIANAIIYWFGEKEMVEDNITFPGATIEGVKRVLEQNGIKPTVYEGQWLQVAINHPAIKKMLRNTAWAETYSKLLGRLDYCEHDLGGPGNFAGIRKRYRKINAKDLLENIPF